MIQVLVSILALIAAISVACLLTIIDSIVHQQLYQFGLQFSHDWADPYWMLLRISLTLLGLIAAVASINLTYFFWMKVTKAGIVKVTEKEARVETARPSAGADAPSLFQCTSCGRGITHPLRMLDFQSEGPKMINICPFCNATAVPVSSAHTEEATPAQEEIKKKIFRSHSREKKR